MTLEVVFLHRVLEAANIRVALDRLVDVQVLAPASDFKTVVSP
jgi:hypothetical protein